MKIFLLLFLSVFVLLTITFADPPEPITITGIASFANGTGLPNGWVVHINDTTNGNYVTTEVYAPPIPSLAGSYSAVILGSLGDTIRVWINNATHYAETIVVASSEPVRINVSINTTRGSEANLTIFNPSDSYVGYLSSNLTVNYTVTILGGISGTGCYADVSFSNNSIFFSEPTASLGDLTLGSSYNFSFNLSPLSAGFTNISINASCDSDTVYFDNLQQDSIYDIEIQDDLEPLVKLIRPEPDHTNVSTKHISFAFNVSDNTEIINCSLYLNGSINKTLLTVERDVEQTINETISNGIWNWSVVCFDSENNLGFSENRTINISAYFPEILSIIIENPIMLNPGTNKSVNISVETRDFNGNSDINSLNMTFFIQEGLDNPNYHYTNSSCSQIAASGYYKNFTCNFEIRHFANNGTWFVRAFVKEIYGNVINKTDNTTILPLYSFDLNTLLIDYGDVPAGGTSGERVVNVSNVGNMNFSMYLWTYGGDDNISGYDKSFVCAGNNISTTNHRYSDSSGAYLTKTGLSNTITDSGIDFYKQTSVINSTKSIYWQLQIPVTDPVIQKGTCNGTVVLEAFI